MKLNEILHNIKEILIKIFYAIFYSEEERQNFYSEEERQKEDIEYITKQLYRALKVPDEFIGKDEQPQTIPLENIKWKNVL